MEQTPQKATLLGVVGNRLTLQIGNEILEIDVTPEQLLHILQQENSFLQVGEKIYNIHQINEAHFNTTIHHHAPQSKPLTKRLGQVG